VLSSKCYLGNLHLRKGYSSYLSHSVLLLKQVIIPPKELITLNKPALHIKMSNST
jgi:hypothetical protein